MKWGGHSCCFRHAYFLLNTGIEHHRSVFAPRISDSWGVTLMGWLMSWLTAGGHWLPCKHGDSIIGHGAPSAQHNDSGRANLGLSHEESAHILFPENCRLSSFLIFRNLSKLWFSCHLKSNDEGSKRPERFDCAQGASAEICVFHPRIELWKNGNVAVKHGDLTWKMWISPTKNIWKFENQKGKFPGRSAAQKPILGGSRPMGNQPHVQLLPVVVTGFTTFLFVIPNLGRFMNRSLDFRLEGSSHQAAIFLLIWMIQPYEVPNFFMLWTLWNQTPLRPGSAGSLLPVTIR